MTGCPILTHCEGGKGAPEQVAWLTRHGADAGHLALSHVDRIVDRGYHAAESTPRRPARRDEPTIDDMPPIPGGKKKYYN